MLPIVTPASSFSSPRDYNRNPYTETGYAPKRFRPEEYDEERRGEDESLNTSTPASNTWMPPENDDMRTDRQDPISLHAESSYPTDYTGPVLYPGQLSSLTMYGCPRAAFSSTAYSRESREKSPLRSSHTGKQSPNRMKSQRRRLKRQGNAHTARAGKFSKSKHEKSSHETRYNSGVPSSDSDTASITFAMRAEEAGIPNWNEQVIKGLVGNNSVFDERWILSPDETWNVPARKNSCLTVSPSSRRSDCSLSSNETESSKSPTRPNIFSRNEHPSQETVGIITDEEDNDMKASRLNRDPAEPEQTSFQGHLSENLEPSNVVGYPANAWQHVRNTSDIPEAVEALRFEEYLTDLSVKNGNLKSKLFSYNPASIRKVFNERVFHSSEPEAPQGEIAERLVQYKGKVVHYGEIFHHVVEQIDELVAYMTAPADGGRQQNATSHTHAQWLDDRKVQDNRKQATATTIVRKESISAQRHSSSYQSSWKEGYVQLDSNQKIHDIRDHPSEQSKSGPTTALHPLSNQQTPYATSRPNILFQPSQLAENNLSDDMTHLTISHNPELEDHDLRQSSRFVDPMLSKHKKVDVVQDDPPQFHLQTRLGDPATAEFSPSGGNPYFSANRNALISGGGESFPHARFPPPGLGTDRHSVQEDDSSHQSHTPHFSKPFRPDNYNARVHGEFFQPFTGIPGGILHDQHSGSTGFSPDPVSIQDNHVMPVRRQAAVDQPGSQVSGRRKLLGSLQEPYAGRSRHGMPFGRSRLDGLSQDRAQYQLGLSSQPQMRPHTPDNALHHYQPDTYAQSQDFQRPVRHQLPHFERPRQYRTVDSVVFNTNHHDFPTQNFGPQAVLNRRNHLGQVPTIFSEQMLHQPLPSAQILKYGTNFDGPANEIPTGAAAVQDHAYSPNIEVNRDSSLGAMPGVLGPSYVQPYIPADKYARAPAPNRLASRFAQVHSSQTLPIQSTGALNRSIAAQSRFPSPLLSPRASLTTLPYRSGCDDMFPNQRPGVASIRYQDLTRDEPPRFTIAGNENYLPFVETTKLSKPAGWGVLRVSNIPYDITRKLILSFLGTHAKTITPDLGPSIHIMMDRSTGKTQDCFIEFFSFPDANAWRAVISRRGPHLNKIGDRILEVDISNQEELLKELFPRARCVVWAGPDGLEIKETEEAFDSGFKGFITQEELKGLIHHAEQPHRVSVAIAEENYHASASKDLMIAVLTVETFPKQSVYTQKCPPRPYANMISILSKFPWHATAHYTLSTRNALFNATLSLVKTLVNFLRRASSLSSQGHRTNPSQDSNSSGIVPFPNLPTASSTNIFRPDLSANELSKLDMREKGLNEGLLKELVLAGMNAYGFSESQRYQLYSSATSVLGRDWMRLSPLMAKWPFEVVGRKAGFEEDVVEFYANLLSTHPNLATQVTAATDSTTNRRPSNPQERGYLDPRSPFGNFSAELYSQNVEGYAQQSVTMEVLGKWEMDVIMAVLKAMCASKEAAEFGEN